MSMNRPMQARRHQDAKAHPSTAGGPASRPGAVNGVGKPCAGKPHAELRKHSQVAPGSPHLLGTGHSKRFRRSAVLHSRGRDESRF